VLKKRRKTSQSNKGKKFPSRERIQPNKNKTRVDVSSKRDIIILFGQSNSANSVLSNEYFRSKHLNYFNKKFYRLSNPVLGANGDKDSVAPAIAAKLKSKKPYIFLTNGWGGTSIYDWSHPNSMLVKFIKRNLKDLLKIHRLKYLIWIQGESDNNTDVDYIREFNIFRDNLFSGISNKQLQKAKWIITQTSICGNKRDHVLNAQQKKLAQKDKVYITKVTDSLDINYRFDDCHFNKFGTEKIAIEISKIINKLNNKK
tara:strand:+ start:1440 stop:2210 length:771 start_codon:yes stop_codon:yes gene_type:complete